MPILQEPITPEKQKAIETLLDDFRNRALVNPDVSFLTVIKMRGHPQIMLEVGGDEAERQQLMGFFLKWAMGISAADLKARHFDDQADEAQYLNKGGDNGIG